MECEADVGAFYERNPYPPPQDDISVYRRRWDDRRRRYESHLFWPRERFRQNRRILVAGCGTVQAAHYAVRWPKAAVVGIDVSASSIAYARELKRKHELVNLELAEIPLERATELEQQFDYVVCTGVLHHLQDPDAGLQALASVLAPGAAMHLMLYAPYGRAGVYMLQEFFRRLGVGTASPDELAQLLRALPSDHPIVPLLRQAPDFATAAGIADALLHPRDRAYSVPQLFSFFERGGLRFGRWLRQAPYLASCGAIAATPYASAFARLSPLEQYASMELFRGTMARHSLVLYRADDPPHDDRENWRHYVPLRAPEAIDVRERLPDGAAAVLINRSHTYTDLYLPVDAEEDALLTKIDGARTIAEITADSQTPGNASAFFRRLWEYDQVVFDTSGAFT